jgi:hypothetical protein
MKNHEADMFSLLTYRMLKKQYRNRFNVSWKAKLIKGEK